MGTSGFFSSMNSIYYSFCSDGVGLDLTFVQQDIAVAYVDISCTRTYVI